MMLIVLIVFRNTSTDVEKTVSAYESQTPQEKHLHGRGEDLRLGCS